MRIRKGDVIGGGISLIGVGLTPFIDKAIGLLLILVGIMVIVLARFISSGDDNAAERRAAWRDLATKFEKVPKHIWAEWYSEGFGFDGQPHGGSWLIRDGKGGLDAAHCEALCAIAGHLLMQSRNVALSEKVRTRTDDTWKWLYFLKEKRGLREMSSGTSSARGFVKKTESGDIANFADVCVAVCMELSIKE